LSEELSATMMPASAFPEAELPCKVFPIELLAKTKPAPPPDAELPRS